MRFPPPLQRPMQPHAEVERNLPETLKDEFFEKNKVRMDEIKRRVNAIAGALAGCATAVILHPLDIVRTRFQVNDGIDSSLPKYRNTWNALVSISKNEGLKGLYSGLTPAVVGSTVSWSLYFYFYSNAKERYKKWANTNQLGPFHHLASATEAGTLVSLFTNPVWLVKTRLQIQPSAANGRLPDGRLPYKNTLDAVRSIWQQEGIRGFYRGLGPSLLLVSHGAIQLASYEELRKVAVRYRSRQAEGSFKEASQGGASLTSMDYLLLGFASKLVAVVATYPYAVVRSRLQIRPNLVGQLKYSGSWHAVKAIMRHEGWRGFYKGFVPHVLRVAPSSSVTFLVYESAVKLMSQLPPHF